MAPAANEWGRCAMAVFPLKRSWSLLINLLEPTEKLRDRVGGGESEGLGLGDAGSKPGVP